MLHNFIKNNSIGLAIFVQIAPFLTTNIIRYVLYYGIIIFCDKSPNFMELMLESWFFLIKKGALIKTIKLLLVKNLHSKGLESIEDAGAKNKNKNNLIF